MPEITWSSASSKMRSMTVSTDVPIEEQERLLTLDCRRHFELAMRIYKIAFHHNVMAVFIIIFSIRVRT